MTRYPWFLVSILVAVSASLSFACGGDDLDESLTSLEVGDCVSEDGVEGLVDDIDETSCDEEGALEVTKVFNMDDGDYPGQDAVDEAALDECPSDVVTYLYPTEESWNGADDREIVCFSQAGGDTEETDEPEDTDEPEETDEPDETDEPEETDEPDGNDGSTEDATDLGDSGEVAGVAEIRVIDVDFDAEDTVLAENEFNEPADDGHRMVLWRFEITNIGEDVLDAYFDPGYSLVDDSGKVYGEFDFSCGVIPDEIEGELQPGDSVEGNFCIQAEEDAEGLLFEVSIFDEDFEETLAYFELE